MRRGRIRALVKFVYECLKCNFRTDDCVEADRHRRSRQHNVLVYVVDDVLAVPKEVRA